MASRCRWLGHKFFHFNLQEKRYQLTHWIGKEDYDIPLVSLFHFHLQFATQMRAGAWTESHVKVRAVLLIDYRAKVHENDFTISIPCFFLISAQSFSLHSKFVAAEFPNQQSETFKIQPRKGNYECKFLVCRNYFSSFFLFALFSKWWEETFNAAIDMNSTWRRRRRSRGIFSKVNQGVPRWPVCVSFAGGVWLWVRECLCMWVGVPAADVCEQLKYKTRNNGILSQLPRQCDTI